MRPHPASQSRRAFITRKLLTTLGLTTLIAVPATLIPLHADTVILFLTGITGENTQKGREGSIVCSSMTWEVENPTGKGGAVATPTLTVKTADSTTPYIFERLVNGTTTDSARFEIWRPSPGGTGTEYRAQEIEFKNVRFLSQTDFLNGANTAAQSTDTLKFQFESIFVTGTKVGGSSVTRSYTFP